jgi:hypothetical protein
MKIGSGWKTIETNWSLKLSNLLAVGGPDHGQEVEDVGAVRQKMMMASDPNNPAAPAIAMPTSYIRRNLEGEVGGNKFRKSLYVHESVREPMEMMQLMSNYFIGQWLEDGGELVEEEINLEAHTPKMVSGGNGSGTSDVGPEPPRSASGLYLP